jgi:hypothetical protein
MNEGWYNGEYFILFDREESSCRTEAYGLPISLPGYRVLGLRSWDDFILLSASEDAVICPTVPVDSRYFEPIDLSKLPTELTLDSRFAGKVKWYVTPIVFGGDPQLGENVVWVTVKEHAELVRWWNEKYREIASTA